MNSEPFSHFSTATSFEHCQEDIRRTLFRHGREAREKLNQNILYTFATMAEQSLKQKTADGLLWGGISNGGQAVLNLVFGIFLARILSPSDYGMVGLLTIFSLVANSLQESGFISGLNRKKDASAKDFNAVFWFNVFAALCCYAILFTCAPLIATWFHQPVLVPLARLSFLSFVISSFGTTPRAWLFRNLKVKDTALVTMVALIVSGITGIVLALLGFAFWGLCVQNLVYCFCMTVGAWLRADWKPMLSIDLKPIRSMFAYSSKILATNVFMHINNNLFSLFFGRLYGERLVGFYNQANKWTGMGYTMLTGMVWSVTQPLFARLAENEPKRMRDVFRKMLRFTAFLSFPCLFGLGIIAPEFITIAITEKWMPAADLMKILCAGGAFVPVAQFYANFLLSQGKSDVFMWNTIALCLAQIALLIVLHPFGVKAMVTAYVALNVIWLFVWHRFVWLEIRLRLLQALADVLPFAGLALVAVTCGGLLTKLLTDNLYASLILKILFSGLIYVSFLLLFRARVLFECIAYARKKLGKASCCKHI